MDNQELLQDNQGENIQFEGIACENIQSEGTDDNIETLDFVVESSESVNNSVFDDLIDAKFDQEKHPDFDFLKWIATYEIEYTIRYFKYSRPKEITLSDDDFYWYWQIIGLVDGYFDEQFWTNKAIQSLHNQLKYCICRNYYTNCDVFDRHNRQYALYY